MNTFHSFDRRRFLQQSSLAAAGAWAASQFTGTARAAVADGSYPMAGRLYKTLKIGMIKVPGGLKEKFAAAKEAGFAGVELNAPGFAAEEVRAAIAATGLPVDGTVCSSHWNIRHTSPDAETRARALHVGTSLSDVLDLLNV